MNIFGLLLLALPFLPLTITPRPWVWFFRLFTLVIGFHLTVTVVTQALGMFTWPVVAGAHVFGVLALFTYIGHRFELPTADEFKEKLHNIDWALIFVIILSIFTLLTVHYNYTGKITTAVDRGYEEITNMRYPYPYYSDEWYSIAFIQDTIERNDLPFNHPFLPDRFKFLNLEFAFHSLLAEIVLLIGLIPLTQYVLLTVGTTTIIAVLVYGILRLASVSSLSAAIAALSVLYISHGASLPGLWALIPVIVGIICLLLTTSFLITRNLPWALGASALTLLFYPPLVIFTTAGLLTNLLTSTKHTLKEKSIVALQYSGILIVAAGIVSLYFLIYQPGSFQEYVGQIWSKLYYNSFTPQGTPRYVIYEVMPLAVFLLALLGIPQLLKKYRSLASMIGVGLIFWFIYSFFDKRFIIEYQRDVLTTSILLTLTAGLGIEYLVDSFPTWGIYRRKKSAHKAILVFQLAALALFLGLYPTYTQREVWRGYYLQAENGQKMYPAAPANRYLTQEDLDTFSSIENKRFLSIPWKGTTIGVATNNDPAALKSGTVSLGQHLPSTFVKASCEDKLALSAENELDYIYMPPFNCPGFTYIKSSSEGLSLYSVNTGN